MIPLLHQSHDPMDRAVVVDVGTAVHVLPSGWAHAVGCLYDMLYNTGRCSAPSIDYHSQ